MNIKWIAPQKIVNFKQLTPNVKKPQPKPAATAPIKPKTRPTLEPNTELWEKVLTYYIKTPDNMSLAPTHYKISQEHFKLLVENVKAFNIKDNAK